MDGAGTDPAAGLAAKRHWRAVPFGRVSASLYLVAMVAEACGLALAVGGLVVGRDGLVVMAILVAFAGVATSQQLGYFLGRRSVLAQPLEEQPVFMGPRRVALGFRLVAGVGIRAALERLREQ